MGNLPNPSEERRTPSFSPPKPPQNREEAIGEGIRDGEKERMSTEKEDSSEPLPQRSMRKPRVVSEEIVRVADKGPVQPLIPEYSVDGTMEIQYDPSDKQGDKRKKTSKEPEAVTLSSSDSDEVGGKRGRTRAEDPAGKKPNNGGESDSE